MATITKLRQCQPRAWQITTSWPCQREDSWSGSTRRVIGDNYRLIRLGRSSGSAPSTRGVPQWPWPLLPRMAAGVTPLQRHAHSRGTCPLPPCALSRLRAHPRPTDRRHPPCVPAQRTRSGSIMALQEQTPSCRTRDDGNHPKYRIIQSRVGERIGGNDFMRHSLA